MSEREQFEAWYKKYDRDTQRQYWTRESACWHAWQAARAQPAPITSENGNQTAQGASAITSAGVLLHQALTDPENQPNQYGVEFLMNGPKFAFKVGSQQFTLDYEPTEPGEFEFMRDMLVHAFSVFTPDVKPAPVTSMEVPRLTDDEIVACRKAQVGRYGTVDPTKPYSDSIAYGRAIEAALIAKWSKT